MSYGSSSWMDWVKDEEESIKLIGKAYEAGINFFDTADTYSGGESERVLGKAIKEHNMVRSRIVVATKVFFPVMSHPIVSSKMIEQDTTLINQWGLSRKHIMEALEGSLERLQLDYVDILQIHRLDPNTTMEETMEALHDLVKRGKVHYIGACSMPAWQLQKANMIAEKHGWTKFVSMQNLYNLLYREEEHEMIPVLQDQGMAMIPWSPLAMGQLSGRSRSTSRSEQTAAAFGLLRNDAIIDRVEELAQKKNFSPSQIALAWLFSKPNVTSPIIGIGKESHLHEAVAALSIQLTDEEVKYLEEEYTPMPAHYLI
ncbi:NADP-dependent oxidoreductase domain-containing protein [Fennellomyces sp. T-0311]|nr:NADP-dependent oxidoreductase domain-containing protein [Fennellomyces sp. T-0311]